MVQEEKLCNEVETVTKFTYLGSRASIEGGCEIAVTARTRCGWVKFWNAAIYCMENVSSKAKMCFQELCKACNSAWK